MANEKRSGGLTVVPGGANSDEKQFVKRTTQFIGDFRVPHGYEVWGDGVFHVDNDVSHEDTSTPSIDATPSSGRRPSLALVSHKPIWIRRFGRAIDTDEELVELIYTGIFDRGLKTEWVNRLQLASKLQLVKLSRAGLPIHDGNIGAVMAYLDHALHYNGDRLPCVQVAARSGAHEIDYGVSTSVDEFGEEKIDVKHGVGWLLGDRWIGPSESRVVSDPRKMHTMTRGFSTSGEEQKWIDKWREVTGYNPIVRWLCYSTFAPPILRFAKQRTFIVHHCGNTGAGKTAILKFALAAWGDPQLLMVNFNRTEKSFTEMFHYVNDLPVGFDELQSSMAKDHAQIIYSLCLERGRARAQKEGGLQAEIESWRTVVRMTGEEPIIGKGGLIDLGGQSNRVIQISVPVLSSEQAGAIHQWIESRHFGWGGVRFLETLLSVIEQPEGKDLIAARYFEMSDEIRSRSPALAFAHVGQLACVGLAQYLFARYVLGYDPEMSWTQAVEDAIVISNTVAKSEIRESVSEQALQLLHDNFVGNRAQWYDLMKPVQRDFVMGDEQRQMTGIVTPTEVWLLQRQANTLLARAGIPPRRVWSDLEQEGVLVTHHNTERKFSVVRQCGAFRARVYCLLREKAGPFSTSDEG